MKIVFIGGRDIHTLGGIENYMYNLATQLVQKGYCPVVYCESNINKTEYVNGFKVIHQKSVGGRFLCKILLAYKATIRSLLFEKGTAVYHYNAWPPSLASWIAAFAGKKTILHGHGLEWKRTKYTPFQQKILKFMEWLTAKLHKHILMVSQEQTDYFLLHYKKRCKTITTAVNLPSNLPAGSETVLRKYGLRTGCYFLYLGRLVQDKNPDILIKAYIRSGITDKQLVIAGDNPADTLYVKRLHSLAAGHPGILFTGTVYGKEKECLLQGCYAFCIPSTLEGLPIALLEAMSYKRICIASKIKACQEALGENGLWVEPENVDDLAAKLCFAARHRTSLEAKSTLHYRRIVAFFTWDRIADQYIRYIHSICKNKFSIPEKNNQSIK